MNLSKLKGLPLTGLSILGSPKIADLSPLRGMPLKYLNLQTHTDNTLLQDLSPLAGSPLVFLNIDGCTAIHDLSPLKTTRLKHLHVPDRPRMKDLSDLQGLRLKSLRVGNCAQLTNISALAGMPLEFLHLDRAEHLVDISPLKGLPLKELSLGSSAVKDISSLRRMPLRHLNLRETQVEDISPLKGMPLQWLSLGLCTGVTDFSALKGMPLEKLDLRRCHGLTDLDCLVGLPLRELTLMECVNLHDFQPLKGFPLERLNLDATNISDYSPLANITTLKYLSTPTEPSLRLNFAMLMHKYDRALEEATLLANGFGHIPAFKRYSGKAKIMMEETLPAIKALQTDKDVPLSMLREFNGHHYALCTPMQWTTAKALCERLGGHLATFTSAGEIQWVADQFSNLGFYIGARQLSKDGPWEWVTGEPWDFKHWAESRPQGTGEYPLCLYYGYDPEGGLDIPGVASRSFLIEWDR